MARQEYDPEQSMAERREIQRGMRDLIQQTTENQDEFLAARPTLFHEMLEKAGSLMQSAKQTTEATIDSRLILQISELALKRSNLYTSDKTEEEKETLDVDEFVSKCITYMRRGRGIADDNDIGLSSTQRQRRAPVDRQSPADDEGDELNWAHLGRYACVPYAKRPSLPGFLLGPLSLETKKVRRRFTKKTAGLKISSLSENRPQVIQVEDEPKTEKSDLAKSCRNIFLQLKKVQEEAQANFQEEVPEDADPDDPSFKALMLRHGLRTTGGVDFFKFVVNPDSFGQTIENIFHVSFLVRDGQVGLELDDDEVPSLYPIENWEETEASGGSRTEASKQQCVLELDIKTWREIVTAWDIKKPMVPHRKEPRQHGPGATGWYK